MCPEEVGRVERAGTPARISDGGAALRVLM